jgi:hypothetical protein
MTPQNNNTQTETAEGKASPISSNGDGIDLSVNRAAPYDPFNPELFRIDQSELDQPVVKASLTAIPIRKPEQLEFIRVHPDPEYRMGPVPFISLKRSGEYYLVLPALRSSLRPREYWIGEIFLATNRLAKPFFWITTIQSPTGRISDWYNSATECAERAMHDWVQIVSDTAAGVYTAAPSEEKLEEPEWPEQPFDELFRIGFKRRTVENLDHPVFKQLRGRA